VEEPEFNDPRLVAVYDAEFRWGADDDFFVSAVDRVNARVLDLGCGTGRLSLGLAAAGHRVTGVDPARASLDAARAKTGADGVTWVEGTSADLPAGAFDVALMTSHVAQFFADEEGWRATLADLHRALVPGGRLVFDARDPLDRRWELWNPHDSRRLVAMPDGSQVEVWTEVTEVLDDVVSLAMRYRFADGTELASPADLRFRSEAQLRGSLHDAGFSVESVYGGWHREPVGHGDGELLVLARA
jgi:SAM-dependent methyltransferase